jgi:hypothetical protein
MAFQANAHNESTFPVSYHAVCCLVWHSLTTPEHSPPHTRGTRRRCSFTPVLFSSPHPRYTGLVCAATLVSIVIVIVLGVFASGPISVDEWVSAYPACSLRRTPAVLSVFAATWSADVMSGYTICLSPAQLAAIPVGPAEFYGPFINSADDEGGANVVMRWWVDYRYRVRVSFVATRPIATGEEVLVFYGPSYWRQLADAKSSASRSRRNASGGSLRTAIDLT